MPSLCDHPHWSRLQSYKWHFKTKALCNEYFFYLLFVSKRVLGTLQIEQGHCCHPKEIILKTSYLHGNHCFQPLTVYNRMLPPEATPKLRQGAEKLPKGAKTSLFSAIALTTEDNIIFFKKRWTWTTARQPNIVYNYLQPLAEYLCLRR